MNEFFIPFGNIFSLFRSKVKGLYNYGFEVINGATAFNTYSSDREKLAMVLANPAVLKVFALQCDLFSMGKVCVKDEKGKEIEDDPFMTLIEKPNPLPGASQSQFLFDFMFWHMLGTSYAYVDSKVVDRTGNKIYYLDPSRIEWPLELEKRRDKMVFSDAEVREINKMTITYRYADGTTFKFPFERLVITFDLTNGVGNFYKGISRLDALYKVVSNAEHTLDSENINIRYTSKFLVGADRQSGTNTRPGMSDQEKNDIIEKIDHRDKNVYPINSKINIQRFVENLANLQLPQEYLHQYFLIGNMYNIPRDVLEAYNSATYENQEKARAAHVNYTLDPKGNTFMDAFEVFFGYREQKKNIVISWDHLPFMQIFAKERAEGKKVVVEVLNSLLTLGVSIDQANEYLGTEFKIEKPPPQEQPNEQGQTESGQGSTAEEESGEGEGAAGSTDNQKIRLLK